MASISGKGNSFSWKRAPAPVHTDNTWVHHPLLQTPHVSDTRTWSSQPVHAMHTIDTTVISCDLYRCSLFHPIVSRLPCTITSREWHEDSIQAQPKSLCLDKPLLARGHCALSYPIPGSTRAIRCTGEQAAHTVCGMEAPSTCSTLGRRASS